MNTMPHEEQDFQDFLSGRDDLSKQLKSLPQPSPSAALDAAIFASISNELAKELEKKSAAAKKTKPALAQLINFLQDHLRSLWYLPVGAAALLLIGLNLREPSQPVEIAMQTAPPVAATAAIPPEFEVDSVLSETTVVAAPKAKAAKARIPRNHIASNETAASKEILVQAAVVAPTLQRVEVSGSRISSLPVTSSSAMNSIAPAPEAKVFAEEKTNTVAELSSTKADKPEELAQLRAITAVEDRQTDTAKVAAPTSVSEGYLKKELRAHPVMAMPKAIAPEPTTQDWLASPNLWLARIEALLDRGLKQDALKEWAQFQKDYPRHPVAKTLQEKLALAQDKKIP